MPNVSIPSYFERLSSLLLMGSCVCLGRYEWDEGPVVDIVTGWSRRMGVLGKGQRGVHAALNQLIALWPYEVWAFHSDNGAEFLSHHIIQFAKGQNFQFTRGRPYRNNDIAHVEPRNRQFVRDIVGYARYDRGHRTISGKLYAKGPS